jgi:hypothetical protein
MLILTLKTFSRFGEKHAKKDFRTLGTRVDHRFFGWVLSVLSYSDLMDSVGLPFVSFLWGPEIS